MRDLTARLRDIVRRESGAAPAGAPPVRELTVVPEVGFDAAPGEPAAQLGGRPVDPRGACLQIDYRYSGDRSHGRRPIEAYRLHEAAPIALFDPRLGRLEQWTRRVVFFDIETTGLSGGAGTLAFLVGCGWFDDEGHFTVRQFFLAGPSGEKPMLDALGRLFDEATLLVTYNGRTFDVPFMETRWAFHRASPPTDDLPHVDMLPPARRLWGRRDLARPGAEGCSLTSLERRVLGVHRHDDVPGFEIPARYFQFLRTGDVSLVDGILEHNRHDLISLAAVTSHALWLVQQGPEACREPSEQLALGQLYERAGDLERAVAAYEAAGRSREADVQRLAWTRLARLHRRHRRYDEAAEAWQQVLDLVPPGRRVLTALEREAVEALAVHHEHRARDLDRARAYAEALGAAVTGRHAQDAARRLTRIRRKLAGRSDRRLDL